MFSSVPNMQETEKQEKSARKREKRWLKNCWYGNTRVQSVDFQCEYSIFYVQQHTVRTCTTKWDLLQSLEWKMFQLIVHWLRFSSSFKWAVKRIVRHPSYFFPLPCHFSWLLFIFPIGPCIITYNTIYAYVWMYMCILSRAFLVFLLKRLLMQFLLHHLFVCIQANHQDQRLISLVYIHHLCALTNYPTQ